MKKLNRKKFSLLSYALLTYRPKSLHISKKNLIFWDSLKQTKKLKNIKSNLKQIFINNKKKNFNYAEFLFVLVKKKYERKTIFNK